MSLGSPAGCRDVVALLGDYYDDELSFLAKADVETHLAACVRCLAYLTGYRETQRLARTFASPRGLHAAALAEDFVQTLLASRVASP